MGELGQAPRPAEHAGFLHQTSVGGNKIDFVETSSFAQGQLTLAAGESSAFNIQLTLYMNGDPNQPRRSFEEQISWAYVDFFIDNNFNLDYEYAIGGLLSTGQKKIVITKYEPLTHIVIPTQRTIYHVTNNDTISHTVYAALVVKYIELAR